MRIITYLLGKKFIRTSIGYIKRGQISDFPAIIIIIVVM